VKKGGFRLAKGVELFSTDYISLIHGTECTRRTFSPAARPLANRPHAPQNEVHMDRKNATTAPTVSQFAFP